MKFHHVTLEMPLGGEEQARQFYVGLLGLQEIAIPATLREHEGGSVWFAVGSESQLHLGPVAPFQPPRRAHFAFWIGDLPGLTQLLEQAGVPVEPAKQEPGWKRCYARDPFGNRVELRQLQEEETV